MAFRDPPGFKRVDHHGQRIFYLTIPDPTEKEDSFLKFTNVSQVKAHLMSKGLHGEELTAALKGFDFTKRKLPEIGGQGSSRRRWGIMDVCFQSVVIAGGKGLSSRIVTFPILEQIGTFQFSFASKQD